MDTASVGTKTFNVTATDAAGNSATKSIGYTVSYAVFLLYDPTKSTPNNAIALQLRDANGVNVSSSSIVLTVQKIDSTPQSGTFSYMTAVKSYGYVLPKALASGAHTLHFTAGNDPTLHSAAFTTH